MKEKESFEQTRLISNFLTKDLISTTEQTNLLTTLVTEKDFREQFITYLKPKNFPRTIYQDIFQLISSYSLKYKETLTQDVLTELCKKFLEKYPEGKPDLNRYERVIENIYTAEPQSKNYTIDKMLEFVKKSTAKEAVLDYIASATKPQDIEKLTDTLNASRQMNTKGEQEKTWNLDKVFLATPEFNNLKIKEPKLIIDPWLAQGEIGLISGKAGIGKTYWTMSLIEAIARGLEFGPWSKAKETKCLYIDAELPLYQLKKKFETLGISWKQENIIWYSGHHAYDTEEPRPDLTDITWQKTLKEKLIKEEIKLVVFDNIGSLTPGRDENDKKSWDVPDQFLIELRYEGITSLLIHHLGKNPASGPRGTSGIEDHADLSILLLDPPGEDTGRARFILTWRKKRFEVKPDQVDTIFGVEWELIRDKMGIRSFWTSRKRQTEEDWRIAYLYINKNKTQEYIKDFLDLNSRVQVGRILKRLADKELIKVEDPGAKKKKYTWTDKGEEWKEQLSAEEHNLNPHDKIWHIDEED